MNDVTSDVRMGCGRYSLSLREVYTDVSYEKEMIYSGLISDDAILCRFIDRFCLGYGMSSGLGQSADFVRVYVSGERTVKKLRLSKALTIPEGTSVSDACRRMAQRRVDAVLLTDSNGLLSGIVTDKDISTRVIAEGLRTEQTVISKIMTRNPIFVMADTLAIEALQKMVQGKFRHLPVVENGEVIAMLDITKCLYDAISRMEKAAEQGSALAAAVEGVERQWGSNYSAPYAFIETLRERMFKPSLSTIITENSKVAVVSPSDPVYVATKKMRDLRVNSVIIVTGGQPQGILTSKDVLMRVVAQNLSPELTLVEKVMTANPECATLETTILDALHIMHDGKFLHLPIVDGGERMSFHKKNLHPIMGMMKTPTTILLCPVEVDNMKDMRTSFTCDMRTSFTYIMKLDVSEVDNMKDTHEA
ncbi:uncharacterized protein A4U43_C09F9860 [Asparagus officinalis]|uniref:CBS domain-containing protein n=1 Tax=Asparagus officinalis TaxID=4686 RepID=A0A5P1E9U1_ASPOF|nr:uncharacterized protein A4U43_C09F9860 [Asparagus officinalis]